MSETVVSIWIAALALETLVGIGVFLLVFEFVEIVPYLGGSA